jgi:hypothetical protein
LPPNADNAVVGKDEASSFGCDFGSVSVATRDALRMTRLDGPLNRSSNTVRWGVEVVRFVLLFS